MSVRQARLRIDVRGCGIHLMCPTCCIRPGREANGVWFCIPLHLLLTGCVCSKLCVNISDWGSCVRIDFMGFAFLKKHPRFFFFLNLKSTPFLPSFLRIVHPKIKIPYSPSCHEHKVPQFIVYLSPVFSSVQLSVIVTITQLFCLCLLSQVVCF